MTVIFVEEQILIVSLNLTEIKTNWKIKSFSLDLEDDKCHAKGIAKFSIYYEFKEYENSFSNLFKNSDFLNTFGNPFGVSQIQAFSELKIHSYIVCLRDNKLCTKGIAKLSILL